MMKTINKSTRLDFSYTSQIPSAIVKHENSFHKKIYESKKNCEDDEEVEFMSKVNGNLYLKAI